jgi:putative ABC transport system substrate-binding protein
MAEKRQFLNKAAIIAVLFILAGVLWTACGNDKKNSYTVGAINIVPDFDSIVAGFKSGMAELGYVEGENITYIYDGATVEMGKLDAVAQGLVAADVDLILSVTTPATKAVKRATAGTDRPVVFVPVTDPVKAGIVNNLRQPGGNITGITFGVQEARRMEWLVRIAPGIEKIYVPYNPEDQSPVLALAAVNQVAATLGVDLITREIRNPEELNAAIENIPAEADAVFLLPDSLLSTRLSDIVAAATRLKLPVSGANVEVVKAFEVLTSYGFDQIGAGKQAARLADQIFQGVNPADLPVETAEFFLAVNLKVAKAIGLEIPNEILLQAEMIIR